MREREVKMIVDGVRKIIGLDWDSGEQRAGITLPDSYRFDCAGGFIWPLPSGNIFVGCMFGPVLIQKA